MKRKRAFVAAILLAAFVATPVRADEHLVFGIMPYSNAADLYTVYKPIADAITKKIGMPVKLQVGKSYEETLQNIVEGGFDFSMCGYVIYIRAKEKSELIPLAMLQTGGKTFQRGVLVVNESSGITSAKDLKGKRIAFGDKSAGFTHLMMLYALKDAGVELADLKEYAFLGTNENIARYIVENRFDAGMILPGVAEKFKNQGLKVIANSQELPEFTYVARAGMAPELAKKLQEAFLTLDLDLLKAIKPNATGMATFKDQDFDSIRGIIAKVHEDMESSASLKP